MRKAVITGATGAIGRALTDVCINAGYDVIAVVHRTSLRASELDNKEHCQVLCLDLDEYDNAVNELKMQQTDVSDCELFFHLAWKAPFGKDRDNADLQLSNVRDSLAAVRLAKALGCKAFIGTGSQAEYGRTDGILTPNTPAFPETGYGIAKLCAGQMTRLLCEQLGMKHIWCRVLSVYGPYDREQTLISYAIIKMMNNEDTQFSPCEQMWDYIYSYDAARAILLAGEKGRNGGIFIIGSGEIHPLREYITAIAAITGCTKEIGFGKRDYNDKQVMFLQADTSALEELGYRSSVSFEEGVREIIRWKKGVNPGK